MNLCFRSYLRVLIAFFVPVLVMENERLIRMLTQENLSEFIMLEHARRHSRGTA